MDGEVGSMDFLGGNPKNFRFIKFLLFDFVDELISGRELNGRILVEFKFSLDLFFLHVLKI